MQMLLGGNDCQRSEATQHLLYRTKHHKINRMVRHRLNVRVSVIQVTIFQHSQMPVPQSLSLFLEQAI